ncbi:MAG: ligand-binding sensor domain-containing protein, partial [Vicinamibacteria bacterium]
MSTDHVYAIRKDRNGELWLARSLGLERFDPRTSRFRRYRLTTEGGSSDSAVWAMHEAEDDGIWLGTSSGLLLFDSQTGNVIRYTDPSGTPLGTVVSILEDDEGRLWLGRTRGLSRFDPETEEFRHYGSDETLRRQSFSPVAFKSRTGRLFFGAGDGLTAFLPSAIEDARYAPPVVLTRFEVAHQPVPIDESSLLNQSITKTEVLTLPYRERIFSIEFAALSYRAPDENRYRYRLEGFDEDWTEVDSRRRLVTYTNLPPGGYVFRVMGSNNDGFWNEEGATLRLQVLPFWWQRWWSRVGGLMMAALALFAAHRLRLRSVAKRAAELQREVEARKTAETAAPG